MKTGIDSPVDCTKRAPEIVAAGATFVGRYYRKPKSSWAALTSGEVDALREARLSIVALWESASNKLDYFSYAAGVDDGTSAYRQALHANQSPGTPIYYAVDFDASQTAVAGAIADYFRGVVAGYDTISAGKPSYKLGIYGSGRSCGWLRSHGLVSYTWLAMSTGWAGYDFPDWNLKQHKGNGTVSFNHDNDEATDDFGAF